MAAIALEIEDAYRPCARCTSGPAIWPSLVTWPTSSTVAPFCLAKRISASRRPCSCDTVPGADSTTGDHRVWIESITRHRRRAAFGEGGEDVRDIGLGREQDRRVGEAEALGPEPDLGDRLLAGDIDDAHGRARPAPPAPGAAASTCRCPDRRRSARAEPGTKTAAGHPVELGNAALDALRARASSPLSADEAACPALGQARALGARTAAPPPPPRQMEFHSPQLSQRPAHLATPRRRPGRHRCWRLSPCGAVPDKG